MFAFVLFLFVFISPWVNANIAPLEQEIPVLLSNGETVLATPRGSREHHWLETSGGDLLIETQGQWFYAELNHEGVAVSTGRMIDGGANKLQTRSVASVQASNVTADFAPTGNQADIPSRKPFRYAAGESHIRQPLLVVRVAFANQGFFYSDAEIAKDIFAEQNSVRDYFLENSYDKFNIEPANELSGIANDGVVQVQLSGNHPDFGTGYGVASQNLARNALAELPSSVNLASYDRNGDSWLDPSELAIVFIVAGYEQAYAGAGASHPRVWAHKSSLYRGQAQGMHIGEYAVFGERHQGHQATIGIICHELGHLLFDLPDLYDRRGESMGVGRWGLMGLGGWNSSAGHAGNRPAHMLAWSKEQAGFVQPSAVPAGRSNLQLRAVTDAPDIIEVSLDGYRHGERLMLEHRRLDEYDMGLPGEGVLITRINDWVGYGPMGNQNDDADNKLVAVQEADGNSDLDDNRNRGDATDVFRSSKSSLLLSAVNPSPGVNTNPGAVELISMEAGLVADIEVNVLNVTHGDNIGFDEVGPNATWGARHSDAQALLEIPLSDKVVWLDGVDWFALGSGRVDIEILRVPPQYATPADRLWQESGFPVSKGWNRLMLKERLENKGYSQVYLLLTSRTDDEHAPLATDMQGLVSGNTQIRATSDDNFSVANFDIAARLLVMNKDVPAAPLLNKSSATVSRSKGASSSGGALGFFFLLMLVPVWRRV